MKDEIVSKIEKLREYVEILKGYQNRTLDELKRDVTLRGAVERYLEVALKSALDMGGNDYLRGRFKKAGNISGSDRNTRREKYIVRGLCQKVCTCGGV